MHYDWDASRLSAGLCPRVPVSSLSPQSSVLSPQSSVLSPQSSVLFFKSSVLFFHAPIVRILFNNAKEKTHRFIVKATTYATSDCTEIAARQACGFRTAKSPQNRRPQSSYLRHPTSDIRYPISVLSTQSSVPKGARQNYSFCTYLVLWDTSQQTHGWGGGRENSGIG